MTRSSETTADTSVLHVGGASPYDVVVGRDLLGRLPEMLGPGVEKVGLIFASGLGEAAQRALEAMLPHCAVLALGVPDGEAAKTAETVQQCWLALGEEGFTRSDAIVTFGGGATTDVGGFVAATWLRGVRVVHVPTTVLGMVDAAVGGKTGINTDAGKNLVGSFHEPAGVLCDLDLLAGLPAVEVASGLGEVVKCGFFGDTEILRLVEADPEGARDPSSAVMRELVERAIRVKIDVVVDDLKETGGADGQSNGWPGREALNYGHTLAHALERSSGYAIRHGAAVAVGSVFVAELAARAGLIDAGLVARHRTAFSAVGLPVGVGDLFDGAAPTYDEVRATMAIDKKSRGKTLRFVVLDGLGSARVLAGPDDDLLRAAYAAIGGTIGGTIGGGS